MRCMMPVRMRLLFASPAVAPGAHRYLLFVLLFGACCVYSRWRAKRDTQRVDAPAR